jgi:phosphoribosyl 1,2-cyclic phosphodiesterase
MAVRFCVLASGSSGNVSILDYNGFGILIDIGLGPRLIAAKLATIGYSWNKVHAVLLTHTHTDHWKERTLAQLRSLKIPLYCHPAHQQFLDHYSPAFPTLKTAGLVRNVEPDHELALTSGLLCLPIHVPHDCEPTLAFRLDGSPGLFGPQWSLGYASDLGAAPPNLIRGLRDVHVLALEFNHDVEMEHRSSRPRELIERVLSDRGHLSNHQAAQATRRIIEASSGRMLRDLVQLHLSQECNRHKLARSEATAALRDILPNLAIHTATQDRPTNVLELENTSRSLVRK